jgi:hypothetical protein
MEDIINTIDGQVQIIFEKGEDNRVYRDAIWMTQAEYDGTSASVITAIKQERYDNWLAIINAMPTEASDEVLVEEIDNTTTP